MFLFTNAPVGTRETGASAGSRVSGAAAGTGASASAGTGGGVVDAIRDGAQSSGVGFDYLLATAQRESGLDPRAKAATSSASGLFQFIEQTWLGTMKAAGSRLGLSGYADAITARADGSYGVADPATRQTILDLRRDPRVSAAMAGALTQRNREALSGALGHEPTSGDLYAAHVLGAKGAATLINSAQGSPARSAALDLPEAASANRSLFYDRGGRARGSAELYALLSTSTAGGKPAVAGTTAAEVALPETATAYASLDTSLRSLFQTDRRQGAVSAGVARLWQSRGTAAATGTDARAPTYFPRSDGSQDGLQTDSQDSVREPETTGSIAAPAETAPPSTASADPIVVPLPPRRLPEFAQAGTAAAGGAGTLTGSAARTASAPRAADLIDFSSYALRNGP